MDTESGRVLQQELDDDEAQPRLAKVYMAASAVFFAVALALLILGNGLLRAFGLVLLAGAAVLLGLGFRVGFVPSHWFNPDLYLPGSFALGGSGTARYRHQSRVDSGAEGASLSAELSCVEQVGDSKAVIWRGPCPIHEYHDDSAFVEADIAVEIPVFEAPPTTRLRHHRVDWFLTVTLDGPASGRSQAIFDVTVDPEVQR